ncbi:MAG: hypothetical protein GY928_00515 [Colwellia sp.]|nr:hypothetical protein [Colwellia sp.]
MIHNNLPTGYGTQIFVRIAMLCGIWVVLFAYNDLQSGPAIDFLISRYFLEFCGFALAGSIFYVRVFRIPMLLWRLLLELFFCICVISIPLEIAYYNEWSVTFYSQIFLLFVYTLLFMIRIIYWKLFEKSLLELGKLELVSEQLKVNLNKDGYIEVYELGKQLKWLQKTAFWEFKFFSKEASNFTKNESRMLTTFMIILLICLIVIPLMTGFNIFGVFGILLSYMMIPLLLRVTIANSFLDLIVAGIYSSNDKLKF